MRRRVTILPDDMVNLIAAGEVVERPASVVKELVENALDAGARRISVRIKDGGRRIVSVADDGGGMSRDDALLAVERHATSKIGTVDDLAHISTFGFRGEALPSIAAVGSFLLETWDGTEEAGTRLIMERGRLLAVEDCARPAGTTAKLTGIFAHVPARRKFLRSRETEMVFCLRAVEEAALARPDVSFEVEGDEGNLLVLPQVKGLGERVHSLWGGELGRALLPLAAEDDGLRLAGFVSPPSLTWNRRDRHHVLVNGRPVRDPVLNRAIGAVLSHRYPAGRHPALVLSLDLPPEEVDVNVHPAKREVRFRSLSLVQAVLERAVRSLGRETSPVPSYPPAGTDMTVPARDKDPSPGHAAGPPAPPATLPARRGRRSVPEAPLSLPLEDGPRFLGQVLGTYVLFQRGGELLVVDQHAAHERILYNRLLSYRASRAPSSQALLLPALVELGAAEMRNLLSRREVLSSFGFSFEEFGRGAVRLTAVPADIRGEEAAAVLRETAADLSEVASDPEAMALAVARRACHASIRAGRVLASSDVERLLADLAEAESGFSCPHGRPTTAVLRREDLEKLFGRR